MSDMKEVAKPYSALELQTQKDWDLGTQDAAVLNPAKENQSQAYYEAYGQEYALQMSQLGQIREG